jgi:hypothetical protein
MQDPAIIGAATSVITELLMFIPLLRRNSLTAAITAIVVLTATSFIVSGKVTIDNFALSLVFALTSYKAVIQPVMTTINSPTQDRTA